MNVQAAVDSVFKFFKTGVGGYNVNHLFGKRRVYTSPFTMSDHVRQILFRDKSLLAEIARLTMTYERVVVLASVVDDELRAVAHGVLTYGDYPRFVGMDCPMSSGVYTYVVSRGETNRQLVVSDVRHPQPHWSYDEYDVELNWSMHVADIRDDMFHEMSYRINEC